MNTNTHIGYETLRRFDAARNYNRWIADTIRPYVGQRVLEIGAGIGNLSQQFLSCERLVLTDMESHYVQTMSERFAAHGCVSVFQYNVEQPPPNELRVERFDTVICLNVIEHVENDIGAMQHIRECLEPGGHALLLVPAHQWLFCKLDVNLGHYRRYSRALLRQRATAAGLEVRRAFYFNPLAALGWFFAGKVFCGSIVPDKPLRGFDSLVPLLRMVPMQSWPVGVSVIAIATRR